MYLSFFCLLSQNIRRNFPRMLGYSDGQHTTNSQFGPVSTAFRMDDVQCTGNEASLLDCPHNPRHNCGSHEGAGVICSNSSNSGRLKSFWKNVGCVSQESLSAPKVMIFQESKNCFFHNMYENGWKIAQIVWSSILFNFCNITKVLCLQSSFFAQNRFSFKNSK